MLNPRLIEVYGKNSESALEGLIKHLGDEYAKTCYVYINESFICKGVKLPSDIMTIVKDNETYVDLRMRTVKFMDEFTTNPDPKADVDESEIYVFMGENPDEKDTVPLWVSDNKSKFLAASVMAGEHSTDSDKVHASEEKKVMINPIIDKLNDLGNTQWAVSFDNKHLFINLLVQYFCTLGIGIVSDHTGGVTVASTDGVYGYSERDSDVFNLIINIIKVRNKLETEYGLQETYDSVNELWRKDEFKNLCSRIGVRVRCEDPLPAYASIMSGEGGK